MTIQIKDTLLLAIIALALVASVTSCKPLLNKKTTLHVKHSDSSAVVIRALKHSLDSVNVRLKNSSTTHDSVAFTPSQVVVFEFPILVDSAKKVLPFYSRLQKQNGSSLHVFSNGNNSVKIVDSSAAILSRYYTVMVEQLQLIYSLRSRIEITDSAYASFKKWAFSSINSQTTVEFKTPKWALWVMGIELLLLLLAVVIIYLIIKF